MSPTRPAVLITGAAAGIGRATALRFARAGFLVGAYDVDEVGLASLARDGGDGIRAGRLDVTDAANWVRVLDEFTAENDGRLEVLVNNAGVLSSGRFEEIDLAAQQRMVQINVGGVLNGCHTAFPHLARATGARVINLASASAIYGQPELATYSATKFAVRGLTEALDLEWRDHDITVQALWPLFVATAMTDGMHTRSTDTLGIRLTADDVADDVFATATSTRRFAGVHRAVGVQAKVMFAAAQVSPGRVLRGVNRFLAAPRD
ncbi:SDR family oxidoreductase [Nocardioides alcanivorans]|uniref:SDR family oxidoreductase n=1 Tax=Nocardioides alcanivorans TaxID=2897352 RepID=UPI001F27144D|nr:SDR family oxidoreductase [Nocardioides alcanivorans]